MGKIVRKIICIFQLALLTCTFCMAQTDKQTVQSKNEPNLSGTWIRDSIEHESDRSNSPAVGEVKLIIIQRDREIKIARQFNNSNAQSVLEESTYYSDGRGEGNQRTGFRKEHGKSVEEIVRSKTTWKGGKLVSEAEIRGGKSGTGFGMKIRDEWSLSKDGKELIQTTTYQAVNVRG